MMIVTVFEISRLLSGGPIIVYTLTLIYFWFVFMVKIIYSRFYRPVKGNFKPMVSVLIPTYKESWGVLRKTINRVFASKNVLGGEVLILTDEREPEVTRLCKEHWGDKARVLVAPPGKRTAIRMGIEEVQYDFVVVIESDTFVEANTISELVKPFEDSRVGGVVGDQQVHKPYTSMVTFFNYLAELVKYRVTIPALSVRRQVTVLGGRCVAYRRKAVLPLVDGLTKETFLGKPCISGDDGRVTSLLLATGWDCLYQSTARTETLSPPTWKSLFKQRLRWFRNSTRRTVRALLCWREEHTPQADRFWAWKKPLATWQMLSTWTGSLMMASIIALHVQNFWTGRWALTSWFSTYLPIVAILLTIAALWIGSVMTRFVRVYRGLREVRKAWWGYMFFFPGYLLVMWLWHLWAIVTMNKQGWLTREGGPGGFATN